ncbi:MAG: hypothetical protein WCS27_06470, partial [Victivallaceae bacterium]
TERYNDFAVDSAIDWLENADDGDFDDCRKAVINSNGWFDWFVKDRESLGKLKSRKLLCRQSVSGGTGGMKRYELKFNSKFSFTYPKSKFTERMIIETDGKKQFKVLMIYFIGYTPRIERPVTEDEKTLIMAAAENIKKQLESRNIAFFKRQYVESAQAFRDRKYYSKYLMRNSEKPERVIDWCNLRAKGKSSQLKFIKIDDDISGNAGRTGLETAIVQYSVLINSDGKSENFLLHIALYRNLYSDKNAKWKFLTLTFSEEELYKVRRKLAKIKIPRINFKNVPLRDAVKLLQEKGKQYDPENTGVDIFLRLSPEDAKKKTLISLDLSDKLLGTAIYFLSREAKLKYSVTKDGIVMSSPDKR